MTISLSEGAARTQENSAQFWFEKAQRVQYPRLRTLKANFLKQMWICLFEAALIRDEG